MRTRGSTRRSQKSLAAGLQPVGGRRTRHGQVVHHQVCGRRRRRKPSRQRQVRPPDNGAGRVRFGHQPGKELRYGDAPRLDAVRRDVPERGHRAGLGRAGRPGQEPSGYSSPAPESATPRRWKSVSRRRLCAVRFPVTGHVCDSVPHLVLTVFARQLRHTQNGGLLRRAESSWRRGPNLPSWPSQARPLGCRRVRTGCAYVGSSAVSTPAFQAASAGRCEQDSGPGSYRAPGPGGLPGETLGVGQTPFWIRRQRGAHGAFAEPICSDRVIGNQGTPRIGRWVTVRIGSSALCDVARTVITPLKPYL